MIRSCVLIIFSAVILLLAVVPLFGQAENVSQLNNSVLIFIHGDGDYLFHSKDGKALFADEVVLQKSIKTAEQLINSEVFIFHQAKKVNSFLFFAEDNLHLYYYKDGALIEKLSMARNNSGLSQEINFYKQRTAQNVRQIVLYYGHEIPVTEGFGYNNSYKNEQFNISILSSALDELTSGGKLGLLVLSTCFNGTPGVIKQLSSKADYIIASPDDLHLSYMNPVYLKKLNYYRNYDFEDFVVDFAGSAFRELKKNIETVSVISAYKTKNLSPVFLSKAGEISGGDKSPGLTAENCDCEENENFNAEEASKGVIVFYNPPAFGKNKYKFEHSGWGCKKAGNYGAIPVFEFSSGLTGKP